MPSFLADNAAYLLLAVIGFWFAARFLVMPGRSRSGLAGMFRREAPVREAGLDQAAIRTLVEDSRTFARHRPDIRGLLLAGEFASGTARPDSAVVLIFLSESPGVFSGRESLSGWPYPERGHAILAHDKVVEDGAVLHRLVLKGAPPVTLAFIATEGRSLPAPLAPPVRAGCQILDDPAGQAASLRQAWRERAAV
ncbi:hypothetical protein [Rhabdaerophilum sp. SD176]|uniref:hypothetical protein n=1 Tax=Rhabdaerophilum sp. SD176 TaxID=2983548 RepID=UPI0024E03304|nr:hypothetical protein [Rhabdaerophilum sp. SD176]